MPEGGDNTQPLLGNDRSENHGETQHAVRRQSTSIGTVTSGKDVMKRRREGTTCRRVRNLAKCVEDRLLDETIGRVRGCLRWSPELCSKGPPLRAVLFRVGDEAFGGDDVTFPKKLHTLRFSKVDDAQRGSVKVIYCGFDVEGSWMPRKTDRAKLVLSRLFPITIPMWLREDLKIPTEANSFAFAYPSPSAASACSSDKATAKLLETVGGYLYFNETFDEVVHAISYDPEGEIPLPFSEPHWLSADELQHAEVEAPFKPLPPLWKAGGLEAAQTFRWIEPSCGGADCNGLPLGFPGGGFCFLGRFAPQDVDEDNDEEKKSLEAQRNEAWWHRHVDDLTHLSEGELASLKEDNHRLMEELSAWRGDKFSGAWKNYKTRKEMHDAQNELIKRASARFLVVDEGSTFEKVMFGGLWLRFPYAFMMFILLLVALFSGIQMQLFFNLFQAIRRNTSNRIPALLSGILFCIPVVTTCCSVVLDQLVDLLWDNFDQPYLKLFRSTCIAAFAPEQWSPDPKRNEDGDAEIEGRTPNLQNKRETIWWVNLLLLVSLEGVPLFTLACQFLVIVLGPSSSVAFAASWLTFNINAGFGPRMVAGYFAGLLANVVLLTAAFTIGDLKLHFKEARWRKEHHTMFNDRGPRWEQKSIAAALNDYKIFPCCLPWRLSSDTDLALVVLTQKFTLPIPPPKSETADRVKEYVDTAFYRGEVSLNVKRRGLTWAAIKWIPWVLAAFLSMFFSSSLSDPWFVWHCLMITAVCLALATRGTSQALQIGLPDLVGLPFHASIAMFCLFLLVWIFSARFVLPLKADINDRHQIPKLAPMMNVNVNASGTSVLPVEWPDSTGYLSARPYSICQQQWGHPNASVSALDLAALAWISYDQQSDSTGMNCSTSMKHLVAQHFGSAPRVLDCNPYDDGPPRYLTTMFENTDGEGQTIVMAIKGTSTGPDLYLDIDLYAAVKVLQAFSFISPVLQAVPAEVIQKLIFYAKLVGGVGQEIEAEYWGAVTDIIGQLTHDHPKAHIVLTGHSLGGSLAAIGAAQTGKSALVWSAPGTLFSSQYLDVKGEAMQRDVTVVVPDMDVVPRVDVHQSVQQQIQCRDKNGALPHFTDCHAVLKSACEIWRVCGDRRKRDFNCDQYVSPQHLGKMFPDDAWR